MCLSILCISAQECARDAAKTICRLRHADTLMLKVHPENRAAKHLYESAGFVRVSTDPRNGNLVYHCTLT